MVLSDRDILDRLINFDSLGLGISLEETMKLVKEGKIPKALEEALKSGKIIINPFPNEMEKRLGPVSLDLKLDKTVWLPGTSEERYDKIPLGHGLTRLEPKIIDFSQPEQVFGEMKK